MGEKPHRYAQFNNGSIISISFRNFGCFQQKVFSFGPHLNLISGPPKSGKSTILEGINMVFGAKPESFGEGREYSDFIRRGCGKARVVVLIADKSAEDKNIEVAMNIRHNKARYFIDRREVDDQKLNAFRDHFSIRIECPFLFLNETSIQTLSDCYSTNLFVYAAHAMCAERYPGGEFPLFWPIVVQYAIMQANCDLNQALSRVGGKGVFQGVCECVDGFYMYGIDLRASFDAETQMQQLKDLSYNEKCLILKLLITSFQQVDIFPFWCIDDNSEETSSMLDTIMEQFRSSGTQTIVVTSSNPRFLEPSGVTTIKTQ